MCRKSFHAVHCNIVPSDILRNIAEKSEGQLKESADHTLEISAQMRGRREIVNNVAIASAIPTGGKRRTVFDAKNGAQLPGLLVRSEGDKASSDTTVNEAYNGAGKTYDFFKAVFKRNSIDDRGMRLNSTVHYEFEFNNAFWNGQQMVYGDGDGVIFNRFTKSLDIIGHELAHGITQYEADLIYQDEPGALNEHFSDVFGVLVVQYANKQTVSQADWLIGKGLFTSKVNGIALRSMKEPGAAYNDPVIGRDPQPAHMKNFVKTRRDNGGVHINSGIPNKAFYNFATSLGKQEHAWERAGLIWYTTLCNELSSNASFQECATKTYKVARYLFNATIADKLRAAWKSVGLSVSATSTLAKKPAEKKPPIEKPMTERAAA